MPSRSLIHWRTVARRSLDEIESAHAAVGGAGPGRRYATRQINHAYVMLLSSHFQAFCRSLHSEAIDVLAAVVPNRAIARILRDQLTLNRKLDTGNPNPGNLGSDFARLDLDLWGSVVAASGKYHALKLRLDQLNAWRNAIAHQSFDPTRLGPGTLVRLATIRRWRRDCSALAAAFDRAAGTHLATIVGTPPW